MTDDIEPHNLDAKIYDRLQQESHLIKPSAQMEHDLDQRLADLDGQTDSGSVSTFKKPDSRGRFLVAAAALILLFIGTFVWFNVATNNSDELANQPDISVTAQSPQTADRVITSRDQSELSQGFIVPRDQIWEFDPSDTVELNVVGNVEVRGTLRMKPSKPELAHVLRFNEIDETKFVGIDYEATEPPEAENLVSESDIGLWVTGSGQLDLLGSERSDWLNVVGGLEKGDSKLNLGSAAIGWQVDDEISIAPTGSLSENDKLDFELRTITGIEGSTVTLDKPLEFDHPQINNEWTAEVINMTRNVLIESGGNSTADVSTDGRAHIFISSDQPQTIKHVRLRNLGPRKGTGRESTGVSGRHPLYFYNNNDGSRNSIVEGVVALQSGNSAFALKQSNGIVFNNNIAYDGLETAFKWPAGPDENIGSSDIVYDHNLVALLDASDSARFTLRGFDLPTGSNLAIRNSVAIGVQGSDNSSGFGSVGGDFEEAESTWLFENNIAHNNIGHGIFMRTNGDFDAEMKNFAGYSNGKFGLRHDGRSNSFKYSNLKLFSNSQGAIAQSATSKGADSAEPSNYELTLTGILSDGSLDISNPIDNSDSPTLYSDCQFNKVVADNRDQANQLRFDFVNCGLQRNDFELDGLAPGSRIRVQDPAGAFQIADDGGIEVIPNFFTD